jgi:hypothetical protein
MSSTYLDHFAYQRMPHGLSLSSYIGNSARLANDISAGATSLPLNTATTVDLNQYDQLYIFDGLNSEIVTVATAAQMPATSITVSPTAYAHTQGVALCSDGTAGSLGTQLFTTGQWVEDICHQSLWVSTYSNEILSMPTMRAALDEQGQLWFRPRHFPITSLSSLSLQVGNYTATSYDASQAIIDGDRQLVQVPTLQPVSSGSQPPYTLLRSTVGRGTKATLTITYNSGYTQLPNTVQRACSLLVNQCFVELSNPIGADDMMQGRRSVTFTLRGDTSGESLLVKQARKLLQPYIVEES